MRDAVFTTIKSFIGKEISYSHYWDFLIFPFQLFYSLQEEEKLTPMQVSTLEYFLSTLEISLKGSQSQDIVIREYFHFSSTSKEKKFKTPIIHFWRPFCVFLVFWHHCDNKD